MSFFEDAEEKKKSLAGLNPLSVAKLTQEWVHKKFYPDMTVDQFSVELAKEICNFYLVEKMGAPLDVVKKAERESLTDGFLSRAKGMTTAEIMKEVDPKMKDDDVTAFTAQAIDVVDQFRAKGYDGVCLMATKKNNGPDGELYICGKGDSQGLVRAAKELISRLDKPEEKFSGKWG